MEEIQSQAFHCSGLESFTAPPSLRRIGALAFGGCHNLKTFELNKDIRELDGLCLLESRVKALRLPRGLETVGDNWFSCSDIEKVFIPNTVRELGNYAFGSCKQLREVVFEPGSQLETIGTTCFAECGFEEITIPKSVRSIGNLAFGGCCILRSLSFEEGS